MPLLTTLSSASARAFGGNLPLSANEAEELSGVSATASIGAVSAGAAVAAAVTGVGATTGLGAPSISIIGSNAVANATGVASTGGLGSASVTLPPAVQILFTLYNYQSQGVDYGQDYQTWTYNPTTYTPTFVDGSTGGGTVSRTSTTAYPSNRSKRVDSTRLPTADGRYTVYTLFPGYNYPTNTLNFKEIAVSASTAQMPSFNNVNTGFSGSFFQYLSVGYNDTRLFIVRAEGSGSTRNILSYQLSGSSSPKTRTDILPVGQSPLLFDKYTAVAAHPTQDRVVFARLGSNYWLRTVDNWGRSSFPLESILTQTNVYDPSGTYSSNIFGAVQALEFSPSGDYLAMLTTDVDFTYTPNVQKLFVYILQWSDENQRWESKINSDPRQFPFTIATAGIYTTHGSLVWGPNDAYVLISARGTSNFASLYTLNNDGTGVFSLNAYQYPNNYQSGQQIALNYDGSVLFGFTKGAVSNTNGKIFTMQPNNTGIPSSLVYSSAAVNPLYPLDFVANLSLPRPLS